MRERDVDARALRLAVFSDTYPPQVNGVARTLERLARAVEERGGTVRVFTVNDPEAVPLANVERYPSVPFWAYKQLRMAWPSQSRVCRIRSPDSGGKCSTNRRVKGITWRGRRPACLCMRSRAAPSLDCYHQSFMRSPRADLTG